MNLDINVITHFFKLQSKNQQISYTILKEQQLIFSNFPFIDRYRYLFTDFNKENNYLDFIVTDDFLIFGYLKSHNENVEILIGPASISLVSKEDLNRLITKMSKKENEKNMNDFSISYTPLETFFNILCINNCFLNQNIISPEELFTNEIDSKLLKKIENQLTDFDEKNHYLKEHTNSVNYEAQLYYCVKQGDTDSLLQLLENFSENLGQLGPNSLRHYKNAVIILNSLTLRAAISAGVNSDLCYQLGGIYIDKIEKSYSFNELNSISSTMIIDYCERVKQIKVSNHINEIKDVEINKCLNYISDHFREKISIPQIAQNIGYSSEYLSSKFKKVTGKNLPHYVNEKKIEEAQKKLILTEQTISEISDQLSFANQSYFQKIFKDIVGITPLAYRKQNSLVKKNEL